MEGIKYNVQRKQNNISITLQNPAEIFVKNMGKSHSVHFLFS